MSPRRTRRGTIKQDNATPDTTKREKKKITSPKETSHSPPKRRRTTRAAKTKSTSDTEENRPKSVSKKSTRKKPIKSDDSLITEDESFSTINNVSLRNTTKRKNNSLLTDDESPKNSSRIVNSRTRMNTTPKSSPIAVTLSPHRSKKTPRRSPDNLGSPKTHSADTPMKLLKTPRKLVIKNSPSSSSSSDDLKLNAKRRVASKSPSSRSKPKTPSPTITSTSSVAKKKLSTPKKTPSPKKQSPIAKKSTRRNTRRSLAPMSAKKVIISPRLSSMAKKSPSPKKKSPTKLISSPKKLSSPRTMASPKKSLSPLKKQTPSPKKNSPIGKKSPKIITRRSLVSPREEKVTSPQNKTISSVSKKKSPRLAKLSLPVSKIRKSPIKAYSSSKSKVPVVILEKVNSSTRRSEGSSPKSQKSPVKLSPRRSNSIVNTTSTVSPKNLNNSVKKIIFESPSTRRSSKDSRLHLSPKVTLRRSLNLTGCFDESISVLRKKSSTPKYKSNRNRSGIENESEPDMSDTSLINMSDVFDSDVSQKEEKEKNKNGTYELDEPKTPGLRAKKAVKRSSSANTKGNEVESKKVRFAESNVTKTTTTTTNTVKLRTGTPGHRASLRRTSEVRSKSKSPQRVTKSMSANQRRRSSSVSVVEGTPRTPANKKTLNSTHSSNVKSDHKAQLASVNRLSRPRMSFASEKKTETKTPVPKKIPNFAEIHKKTFAKMESVVDAKKRVADRHVAMVNPILSATKSMPVGANEKRLELRLHNGVYNRFGFKMRKTEAVETISKKPISMTSEKKLNARRDILKGVRTNRRFELQMKSRKSFGSK